jgi:predicted amidohydrolase YtcJ
MKFSIRKFLVIAGSLVAMSCLGSHWTGNDGFGGFGSRAMGQEESITTIYHGGEILTMRGMEPEYVESLAVRDGKILFTGKVTEAKSKFGAKAQLVDLGGKTMLPGFIDTHGHFVYFGKNLVDANLFNCADVPELLERMKKQVERTPKDAWIVGFGYQPRGMKEGRPPTIEELDQISKDVPVMIGAHGGWQQCGFPRSGHHRRDS